jgi:hypothetical protein
MFCLEQRRHALAASPTLEASQIRPGHTNHIAHNSLVHFCRLLSRAFSTVHSASSATTRQSPAVSGTALRTPSALHATSRTVPSTYARKAANRQSSPFHPFCVTQYRVTQWVEGPESPIPPILSIVWHLVPQGLPHNGGNRYTCGARDGWREDKALPPEGRTTNEAATCW